MALYIVERDRVGSLGEPLVRNVPRVGYRGALGLDCGTFITHVVA